MSVKKIGEKAIDIVIKENDDCGNSYQKIRFEHGALSLIIKLKDKIYRLQNLTTNTINEPHYEKVEDTLLDIIGYCILELSCMEDRKKLNKL